MACMEWTCRPCGWWTANNNPKAPDFECPDCGARDWMGFSDEVFG